MAENYTRSLYTPAGSEPQPRTGASTARRRRVLFVGEAVTLAHVARPAVLARALHHAGDEVHFACDNRYASLFSDLPFEVLPIRSIGTQAFLRALAMGSPVYDANTLRAYVRDDLDLFRRIAPDLVVGDFRLSLSTGAELAGVPCATIADAYWSPYARQVFPVPDLPLTRILGVGPAQALFDLIRPLVFAHHARPLNQVRRERGLPMLDGDLRHVYTHGDYTLYASVPELAPTESLPENHAYLGPVCWSPATPLPEWWGAVPADRPVVYVTPGSSGPSDGLRAVLEALADLPVTVLASTAGRARPEKVPRNAFVADYLPGAEASARARLVVCNGGSPTTHQALAAGVPVLGIAGNMDQLLNMQGVVQAGAGLLLRQAAATSSAVRDRACALLGDSAYGVAARALAEVLARYHPTERFLTFVDNVTGRPTGALVDGARETRV